MVESSTSHARRLADALLADQGGLEKYVATRRDRGTSWRRISIQLMQDVELDLAPETLRLWFPELEKSAAS